MHDPISGFERIRDFYITYLETAFRIGEGALNRERRAVLERHGTLCAEPLLEPIPRYQTVAHGLDDLVNDESSDPRLPGFRPRERRAFVELALSGLIDSNEGPAGRKTSRVPAYHLYEHQMAMLKRGVQRGKPGIVTSGTGSGKTESFLLPVLAMLAKEAVQWGAPQPNYLKGRWWQDASGQPYAKWTDVPNRPMAGSPNTTPFVLQRAGENRPAAVRALILYPMNALVEDQLTRIRRALDSKVARASMDRVLSGNRLFFGRYTSDTPVTGFHFHPRPGKKEYERRAGKLNRLFELSVAMQRAQSRAAQLDQQKGDDEDVRFLFPSVDGAELTSRWDIQKTPPDILITNIAMLNAMLAREVDADILKMTRTWLTSSDDAYFFLVLDELHLQRGSAGTELSYLLRLLLERLGLTEEQHRHKLRILASSASLPTDGTRGRDSLRYLWDMFGRNGTYHGKGPGNTTGQPEWADAIVPGAEVRVEPLDARILDTKPFIALYAACRDEKKALAILRDPEELRTEWRAVGQELGLSHSIDAALEDVVGQSIVEAGTRLASACWSEAEGRSRATSISVVAMRIFGGCKEDCINALRGLLLVRAAGDRHKDWWKESKAPETTLFRVHTFFRSIDGLFAAAGGDEQVEAEFQFGGRRLGPLGIDRGVRFELPRVRDDASPPRRIIELAYCEACGELFLGGMRGRGTGTVELLPFEPDVEGLPDTASQDIFEALSFDRYALFWPSNQQFWPTSERIPEDNGRTRWRKASFEPTTGVVRIVNPASTPEQGSVPGFLMDWIGAGKDGHGRGKADGGTAVPYACPACETDYATRRKGRLSPIRNFRTGFAKTTQLLATELFDLLRVEEPKPKLVSFADSRQDAAKGALDMESRHHEDLRREVLVQSLRARAADRLTVEEIERQTREAQISIAEAAASQQFDRIAALVKRLDELKVAAARSQAPEVSIAEILESPTAAQEFVGMGANRLRLKPLIAAFVALGVHPTDAAGIKRVGEFHWPELFRTIPEGVDWKDDAVYATALTAARSKLVDDMQKLVTSTMFSKTYFALEETGLGYPSIKSTGLDAQRLNLLNAFLRVFSDAYRLANDPWDSERAPWKAGAEIGARNRVRRFAEAIWPDQINQQLDAILEDLARRGHKDGLIFTSASCVRLVGKDDPMWRCSTCGRVHLHEGAKLCTRCFAPLPTVPTGSCTELRAANFLAKRIERAGSRFRLRCEELTGQTDDPANRQRRFRDIVVDQEDMEWTLQPDAPLEVSSEAIDLLSVTTTMEVGIDIGPLRAVFQANMPPQRFNYQQRVGRAGRRKQAYSMALTVCRSKSHDLYYFQRPEMITGDAPPPPFLTKKQPTAAIRFLRKAWLWRAFTVLRDQTNGVFPLSENDVHGEFVQARVYFDPANGWRERLRKALRATRDYRDKMGLLILEDATVVDTSAFDELDEEQLLKEIDGVEAFIAADIGLAQLLAENGLLPMYGLPTRVRNLYTGFGADKEARGRFSWKQIDRDLDLAIYEFAPGSVLVKDKQLHLAAGFTGPLPEFRFSRGSIVLVDPLADAFTQPFFLLQCANCKAWMRFNSLPGESQIACKGCEYLCDVALARECRTPNGFRTDLSPRSTDDEPLASRRHRSLSAEGAKLDFESVPGTNLQQQYSEQTHLFRINRGSPSDADPSGWSGFDLSVGSQKVTNGLRLNNQVIDPTSPRLRGFEATPGVPGLSAIWLAAPKVTDSLFLAPQNVQSGLRRSFVGSSGKPATAFRAAAISAAYMLTLRAALDLDLDPEEFDVLEPRDYRPSGKASVPVIQIADHLINGAGFCARLGGTISGGKTLVTSLIESMVSDTQAYPLTALLKTGPGINHPQTCDQACYSCIQRYSNQMYHGLLDWRLGLVYLQMLIDPTFCCGLDNSFVGAALADWKRLANQYANSICTFGRNPEVRTVEGLTAFRFDTKPHWALVVHPLWSVEDLPGIVANAYSALDERGAKIAYVNTFDLARRQTMVREKLKDDWAQ